MLYIKIYGVFGKKKTKSVAHYRSLSLKPMLEYVAQVQH